MGDARPFCPRCGEPIEREPAADRSDPQTAGSGARLCERCYHERLAFVDAPDRVAVEVCPSCGAIRRGSRWVDVGAADYADVALEAVDEELAVHVDAEDVAWRAEPEVVDESEVRVHCSVVGTVGDRRLEESVTVPVTFTRATCTRCGRIAGQSYAGEVQLRASGRTPTDEERERTREIADRIVAEMAATGDREAFITEVTETDDGLDLKVSTTNIGRKIATAVTETFGGTVTDSETLVTEDEDGNPVYRVTYAVRLPRFTPGDVIDLRSDDGGPVLVTGAHRTLTGIRLKSGEDYRADREAGTAPDARAIGRREDAEETVVVTVEDDHAVQVLDPETAQATTVSRPDYFDPNAETVPVLKGDRGLYILPEEGR